MRADGQPGCTPRRYAEAAFQLATRDKALDDSGDGLDSRCAMLGGDDVLGVLATRRGRSPSGSRSWTSCSARRVPEPSQARGAARGPRRVDRSLAVAAEYRRPPEQQNGVVEALCHRPRPRSHARRPPRSSGRSPR
jgi:hypothetical protein